MSGISIIFISVFSTVTSIVSIDSISCIAFSISLSDIDGPDDRELLSEWLVSSVVPPGFSNKPVSLTVSIYFIVSVLLSVLVSLDENAVAVVLVRINNPGSVIVVVSSLENDKDANAVTVVSAIVYGSVTVFPIVVVDEGVACLHCSLFPVVFWGALMGRNYCPIYQPGLPLGAKCVSCSARIR